MATTFLAVSIDCRDPEALAAFWGAVLSREVADDTPHQSAVLLPGRPTDGPQLAFQRVPEVKAVKNRLHFDLVTDDFAAELERLFELGATQVSDRRGVRRHWVTLCDIEGNEFDLIEG